MANPNEELRRAKAREDYFRLPLMQRKRNPNALYEWYIERFQADPADKANIPTTNRATVYKWHKEDQWDEYCLQREMETIESSAAAYDEYRKKGYDKLNRAIPEVIESLIAIATAPKGAARDKIAAANSLLDRVGITINAGNRDTMHAVDKDKSEATGSDSPDLDASDADLMAYLVKTEREDIRG